MKIEYGSLHISDIERKSLIKEFKKLQTIDEKYGFWQEKFGLNYSLNRQNDIQEHTFEEFLIIPQNEDEIGELNHRIYNDWLKLVPRFSRKSEAAKWREIFEKEITEASNKERYIENEISNVVDYVLAQNKPSQLRGGFMKKITIPPNKQFVESYEQYLKFESDFNWKAAVCSPYEIQNRLEGIECAKYKIYLREYFNTNKPQKEEHFKLTGEQKVLALYYLKFCDEIKVDLKKAKVYEFFLGNYKQKSVLKVFSNISDYEKEKNLDVLIDFFRWLEINEIARTLEDKLAKMRKG